MRSSYQQTRRYNIKDNTQYTSNYNNDDNTDYLLSIILICVVFSILCFMTSWFFTFSTEDKTYPQTAFIKDITIDEDEAQQNSAFGLVVNSKDQKYKTIPVGPIQINKPNTVYYFDITSDIPVNSWGFLEGEILDKNKDYVFSFGKELWHETGYDEGRWEEADEIMDYKITFPDKGTYYLQVKAESPQPLNYAKITISKLNGSSLPHLWLGIFGIIAAIIFNEIRSSTLSKLFHYIQNNSSDDD
jgi:hypothetical protein